MNDMIIHQESFRLQLAPPPSDEWHDSTSGELQNSTSPSPLVMNDMILQQESYRLQLAPPPSDEWHDSTTGELQTSTSPSP